MKKINLCLVMIVALTVYSLVLATTAVAQETQVTSNIVGHLQVPMEPGRNFVGVNFKNPDADKTAYNVQNLLDTSVLNGNLESDNSDQLILWKQDERRYQRLWLYDSDGQTEGGEYDGLWIARDGSIADNEVNPGDGFWLINTTNEPVEITFSGEVENSNSFLHVALEGRNMLASAWPVDIAVNEMVLEGLNGNTEMDASDQLILWNSEDAQYIRLWLYDSDGEVEGGEYDGLWIARDGSIADNVLSSGSAFWLIRQEVESSEGLDDLFENKPF